MLGECEQDQPFSFASSACPKPAVGLAARPHLFVPLPRWPLVYFVTESEEGHNWITVSGDSRSLELKVRELRGSRLRCLMLTSMPPDEVAATLEALVSPFATVTREDHWMPGGFGRPEETRLDEPSAFPFVTADLQRQLKTWWLKRVHGANTPNWDLVSTCKVHGDAGLLLIEAKAHGSELKAGGKIPGNQDNDETIRIPIEEASRELTAIVPGWHLSRDSHYQL
jgi:hypothetical protein